MKRFYKTASIAAGEGGHNVLLDGRPVRTPGRRLLLMPGATLAQEVADEWAAQGDEIRPDAMGLTRLVNTVLDQMPEKREDALSETMGYAHADLLCYREASPLVLAERQARYWQPWLDWSKARLDAPLHVTTTVEPTPQPPASLAALEGAARALDDWRLVGLHGATRLTGSIVLGFAMLQNALDAEAAFDLAMLEELFEVERWGLEVEQARRHAVLRRDLAALETYFRALAVG